MTTGQARQPTAGHPAAEHSATVKLCIAAIALTIVVLIGVKSDLLAQWEGEAAAYKGWKTTRLRVEGLDDDMASELKSGLALAGKPAFYPNLLEEDISRTTLFLARRGYPYAAVGARFEPDDKGRKLRVAIVVDRGPPVRVGTVSLTGAPEHLEAEAEDAVAISQGAVFSDLDAASTVGSLRTLLNDAGYARANVALNLQAVDSVTVNVGLDVTPGTVNYFRKKIVESDRDDLEKLAGKVADIRRGDRYRSKDLRDAQTNLRRLDLFRRIRVETQEADQESLDVLIDVAMRDPRTIKAGVSYWNDEGFRFNAGWRHRNIFKGGRGVDLSGTASNLIQRAEASTWWPALITSRTNESVLFRVERQNEEAYEETEAGVELASVYYFTIDNNIRTAVSLSNVEVSSKTSDPFEQDIEAGLLTEFSVRANQSDTDNSFNPRSGLSSWTGVKWAPSWAISDNHYLLWEGWAAAYLPVIRAGVFAVRLNLGFGSAIGASDVILPSRRFFSGGANSMRGFSRRKLGPKDSEGAPLGGEAKVEASVEVRRELFWRLWGTLFMDTGQVWYRIDELDLRDLEVAVGPGLWLMTPIGPLRLDAGYRLTRKDTVEPRWAYHIAIGPAY